MSVKNTAKKQNNAKHNAEFKRIEKQIKNKAPKSDWIKISIHSIKNN